VPSRRLGRRDGTPLDVRVAEDDLPAAGAAMTVIADDGREALVVRVDADAPPVAFDRRCPHLGCPVLWSAERARFECPCHHAAFDARTGAVLFGPPRRGLAPARLQRT
jgi:Rieske Fe-S protein